MHLVKTYFEKSLDSKYQLEALTAKYNFKHMGRANQSQRLVVNCSG